MRKMATKEKKEQKPRSSTAAKTPTFNKPEQPFKYYIGHGNNQSLVQRVLRTRTGWMPVESTKEMFINLRWQQGNKNFKYENCIDNRIFKQSLNHFEYHHELSNKEYLFKNLYDYCQRNKINVFEFVPLTFILNISEANFEVDQHFFLNFYNQHLPKGREPGELILRRRRVNPNHVYSMLGRTGGLYCKYEVKDAYNSQENPYYWILKPTFYNRVSIDDIQGSGIHLFSELGQMEELMNRYIQGVTPGATSSLRTSPQASFKKGFRIRDMREMSNHFTIRSNSFVIQKYMEKPLLFHGRKFDIRVWVLVTQQMKVYFFRQGYMRTSSSHYSLKSDKSSDLNVHLTNNAVQKYGDDYGKYQNGNQLSFQHLRDLIKENGKCMDDIMCKIRNIVKISMLSVRKKLNKHERSYCFEIFGYDFMLDEQCNPWLIEVNTNPCLDESSPLLQELLPRMLDNAFALTIDQIFEIRKSCSHFSVSHTPDKENMWDLIVDLKH